MEKIVMVTGGSFGSGYAIAARFMREGWDAVITSRIEEKAAKAAKELSREYSSHALGIGLSPDDPEGVAKAFNRLENAKMLPTALVLNASNLADKLSYNYDPLTVDLVLWKEIIDTNIVWNFDIARTAARYMRNNGSGAIAFVSSNTSRRAIPNRTAYIASKGGMNALTRALAVDLGPMGIRVNALVPGTIASERWINFTEEYRQARLKRSPLRAIASFQDIANAAYFLCSGESLNCTGIELLVDGGCDAQLFSL